MILKNKSENPPAKFFQDNSGDSGARKILEYAIETYKEEIVLVSSFGTDSAIILHLISQIDKKLPVIFIDTEWHFAQTLQYRNELVSYFNLTNVHSIQPLRERVQKADPLGDLHAHHADLCCALRKTEPLQNALKEYRAWISGRKRFQTTDRLAMQVFEKDSCNRTKINPLTYWNAHDIERYFKDHHLPRHPLWHDGYQSIGCAPCTKKSINKSDARAGRWTGCQKTECGIHL